MRVGSISVEFFIDDQVAIYTNLILNRDTTPGVDNQLISLIQAAIIGVRIGISSRNIVLSINLRIKTS
ncbi:hypothetical protein C472_00394 [Halorubrum tebenquichense DSM 14210]|uniref:Uncharacterized protein n=1 Tax=Halorubrum tebenquichense DSM 14210 TaxID=1227485 RepID=M0E242_9EURY|nr:hypothetical protein C472_00394 [Halorubrum tebenquichense DSM 14210]